MKRSAPAGRLIVAAMLVLGLAAAATAWACFPQPLLVVDAPASARAGDRVTVRGVNFRGRAEIRLDAIDGPRLATGSGTRFSADVVVPRTSAGIHVLVGVGRDASGGLSGTASAPLEVVASQAPAARRRPASGGGAGAHSSASGIAAAPAAAGGAALLAAGALLGALLARRRAAPR